MPLKALFEQLYSYAKTPTLKSKPFNQPSKALQ